LRRLKEEIFLKLIGIVAGVVSITKIVRLTGIVASEKWNAEIVAPIAKISGIVIRIFVTKVVSPRILKIQS
jgi:hypothetical protein